MNKFAISADDIISLIQILSYHETVNDVIGKASDAEYPIAVTWCPICASAIVYRRTVKSQTLTFGTSGKLANDAVVMYDREAELEWKQPLGTAINDPLKGES